MRLRSLYLKDFRLFQIERIDFSEHTNHFIGDNAQGKTTLIEALFLLSSGKSFRTHHLKDLVREGAERFMLVCHFERYGIEQKIELASDGVQHSLKINSSSSHKLSSLLGLIGGVVISPEDSPLIKAAPEERRRFLDHHLCTLDPLYVHHLHRYRRALKQRSALLKARSEATLHIWDEELAKSAGYLIYKRLVAVEQLEKRALPILKEISEGKETLSLKYRASFSIPYKKGEIPPPKTIHEALTQALKKCRSKDLVFQSTSIGAHRDELVIELDGKAAKVFASEGQKRSILYALRLAQWQLISDESEDPPFIAIDDIGSCLDDQRLGRLISAISQKGQVFLSSPTSKGPKADSCFLLEQGKVRAQCAH
jgi:DNA replication and repair protein RecF